MKAPARHPDLGTLLPIYLAPDDGNPPAGGTPEDRLALVERDNARLTGELAQSRRDLAEVRGECSALRAAVDVAKAAEAKRRAAEVESFIAGLKRQALPNAISEPDLAKVRALMERGDDENAKFVADLLLKGCAPIGATKIVGFGPNNASAEEAAKRGADELLAGIPEKAATRPRRRG